jgi:hypothetical protein
MQPINQTANVLADNEAPEMMIYIMYDLLTEENKGKVNLLIEQLKAGQS